MLTMSTKGFTSYIISEDRPSLLQYVRQKKDTEVVKYLQDVINDDSEFKLLQENKDASSKFIFLVEIVLMRNAENKKKTSTFTADFYEKLDSLIIEEND